MHRVAQIQRAPHRFGAFEISGHPQRKKRRVHAAFLQAHQIDLAVVESLSEIHVAVVNTLDGIDVRVDAEQAGFETLRVFHFVLGVRGEGHCDE